MPNITCTNCGAVLKTPTAIPAGKKVKCPKCNQPFVVGADEEKPADEEKNTGIKEGEPSGNGGDDEGGDEESKGKDKKKGKDGAKKNNTMMIVIIVVVVVLLCCCTPGCISAIFQGVIRTALGFGEAAIQKKQVDDAKKAQDDANKALEDAFKDLDKKGGKTKK